MNCFFSSLSLLYLYLAFALASLIRLNFAKNQWNLASIRWWWIFSRSHVFISSYNFIVVVRLVLRKNHSFSLSKIMVNAICSEYDSRVLCHRYVCTLHKHRKYLFMWCASCMAWSMEWNNSTDYYYFFISALMNNSCTDDTNSGCVAANQIKEKLPTNDTHYTRKKKYPYVTIIITQSSRQIS